MKIYNKKILLDEKLMNRFTCLTIGSKEAFGADALSRACLIEYACAAIHAHNAVAAVELTVGAIEVGLTNAHIRHGVGVGHAGATV